MPSILLQRTKSTSLLEVYRVNNGIAQKVGSDHGVGSPISAQKTVHTNCVAHFGNSLWSYDPRGAIFKYPGASGDWESAHTFSPSDTEVFMGFYPLVHDGETKLFSFYMTSTTSMVPITIDKNENIVELSSVSLSVAVDSSTNGGWKNELVNKNRLHGTIETGSDLPRPYIYDPDTNTLTFGQETGGFFASPGLSSMFRYDEQVYMAAKDNASDSGLLLRVEGGALAEIGFMAEAFTLNVTLRHTASAAFWHDESGLYFMHSKGGSPARPTVTQWGFNADKSAIAFTKNITSIVSNLTQSPVGAYDKYMAYRDTEGTDEWYIQMSFDTDTAGSTISQYRWNGPFQKMTYIGSYGDGFTDSMTNSDMGGGHMVWGSSGEYMWIFQGARVRGTLVDVDYCLQGLPSENVDLLHYFDKKGDAPTTVCTLVDTTQGSISGNYIRGLNIPSSGTFTWNALVDGVVSTDLPSLVGAVCSGL